MSDIDTQLDTLDALQEAELLILQGNYPELASAPVEGYELYWQAYIGKAHAIELKYVQLKWDAKFKAIDERVQFYNYHHYRAPDTLHLPHFTLWDIVFGLLGR
jgi:hypothetical protein